MAKTRFHAAKTRFHAAKHDLAPRKRYKTEYLSRITLAEPGRHKPARRRCLACLTQFPSAWAVERICDGCRSRFTWLQQGGSFDL